MVADGSNWWIDASTISMSVSGEWIYTVDFLSVCSVLYAYVDGLLASWLFYSSTVSCVRRGGDPVALGRRSNMFSARRCYSARMLPRIFNRSPSPQRSDIQSNAIASAASTGSFL